MRKSWGIVTKTASVIVRDTALLICPSVPGFYILNLADIDMEHGDGVAGVLLQAGTAS